MWQNYIAQKLHSGNQNVDKIILAFVTIFILNGGISILVSLISVAISFGS